MHLIRIQVTKQLVTFWANTISSNVTVTGWLTWFVSESYYITEMTLIHDSHGSRWFLRQRWYFSNDCQEDLIRHQQLKLLSTIVVCKNIMCLFSCYFDDEIKALSSNNSTCFILDGWISYDLMSSSHLDHALYNHLKISNWN